MIPERYKTLCVRCVCLALAWLSVAPVLQAQDCEVERSVRGGALDEVTYRQLNNIYEAVAAEQYDEASADLQRLLARSGNNDYMAAVVNQALAQVEWSRQNYQAALRHFELAVSLDTLPNEAHFALMYQIAQLYYMQERYPEAIERLEQWFCTAPPEKISAAAYVLSASIHTAMENYPSALASIDTAIDMTPEPREPWYQLKLGVHHQLEQYPQVAETLELMVVKWPGKKQYWVQLSQTYLAIEQDEKALATLALAWRKGMLNEENELFLLSNLYASAGVPYKAAEILEQAIGGGIVNSGADNWARVAGLWYSAEELEKSLAAYEKAAQASPLGEMDLRRAYILVDLERWAAARHALDAALATGGLQARELGEAYLLSGMTHFNLGDFDLARADWDRASRIEPSRSAAMQWLAHLRDTQVH